MVIVELMYTFQRFYKGLVWGGGSRVVEPVVDGPFFVVLVVVVVGMGQ